MSGVALVQFSSLDTRKFLPLGRQSLDRNLADAADSAGHEPPLHHMLCIAAMKNPNAKSANDIKPILGLFHAGFIIAADERDWAEILEVHLRRVHCWHTPTVARRDSAWVPEGSQPGGSAHVQPDLYRVQEHRIGVGFRFQIQTSQPRPHISSGISSVSI